VGLSHRGIKWKLSVRPVITHGEQSPEHTDSYLRKRAEMGKDEYGVACGDELFC
jgi:hypothetical protein